MSLSDDERARTRSKGGPSPRRASAGIPQTPEDAADRLAELETRLARLERSPGLRERGRNLADRMMPPEATHHFRNAGREQLLGMRSIVDFWIARLDAMDARASRPPSGHETIEVD
jgi:hypothetical protein